MVLLLALAALIALTALVFRLATFTLPGLVGYSAGELAYQTGAGGPGALVVGAGAGIAAFALGLRVAAAHRPPRVRLVVALVFAAPAAVPAFSWSMA